MRFPNNRQVKHHVYGKREFVPPDPFCCRLLFIISTHKLVVSSNFLSIRIVLSCFMGPFSILRNSQFESDVCRLPFAVYVLNLTNVAKSSPVHDARLDAMRLQNLTMHIIY